MPPQTQTKKENKCRVLLFENQTVMGEGLAKVLESDAELEVIAVIDDINRLSKQTELLQPDVILLSISCANIEDVKITPQLLQNTAKAKILLLSSERENAVHQLAVRYGAAGIVYKEQNQATLFKAIKHICGGEVWLNHKLIAQILGDGNSTGEKTKTEDERKIDLLTERERDVINLIAQGLKNKAIAKTLFISEATVRHHLTSIFNKLEVKDRMNLLIFGYKNQLVTHEK